MTPGPDSIAAALQALAEARRATAPAPPPLCALEWLATRRRLAEQARRWRLLVAAGTMAPLVALLVAAVARAMPTSGGTSSAWLLAVVGVPASHALARAVVLGR